eukprot:3591362-Rhodomonas_salina.1
MTGATPLLCCDCTYRLTDDRGQGLCIVSTNCIGQHCHLIAWAVINHEDTEAHEVVFEQVSKAVNQVTAARIKNGELL